MTGGTKLIFLSIKYSKNAEMNNLLDNTFAKPDFFTKKDLRSYYMKSKLANPKVELRETVRLSKEMLQNFHVIVCNTVVNFPETELADEYIHEEGHAFKGRFTEMNLLERKTFLICLTVCSLIINHTLYI